MGARGPHIEHKGLEDEPYSSNPPYLQLFSDAVYVCIAYVSLRPRVPPSLSGAGREGLSSIHVLIPDVVWSPGARNGLSLLLNFHVHVCPGSLWLSHPACLSCYYLLKALASLSGSQTNTRAERSPQLCQGGTGNQLFPFLQKPLQTLYWDFRIWELDGG